MIIKHQILSLLLNTIVYISTHFELIIIIQKEGGVSISPTPSLPKFHTPIDDVDISVNMCGLRYDI